MCTQPGRAAYALILGVAVIGSFALESRAVAQEKLPEAASPKDVKPGSSALLRSKKGMHYFLGVPADYDAKVGARLIVFLHGSNMKGLDYLLSLRTFAALNRDIIVCPNGEQGGDPYGQCNFTMGSAPFVAEITEELQKCFRVRRTFVGGHSQGGFLTYSVFMLHPDLYQGAFPIAGDCWMQNEPNLWEEQPEVFAKQKRIAIAVVHGRKDPVVPFSQGEHAFDVFRVMGFPHLRLFAPDDGDHRFLLLPVMEAIDWLEAMTGDDFALTAAVGEKSLAAGESGSAIAAGLRLQSAPRVTAGVKKKGKQLIEKVESEAQRAAKAMAKSMASDPAERWLPEWWKFRHKFGATRAAEELVKRYEMLRAEQRQRGRQLFQEARALFQGNDAEKGRAVLRKLLEEAPFCFEAYYACSWLAEAGAKQ